VDALNQMLDKYPDFRGVAVWSINEDETRESPADQFITQMKQAISQH
jgi:hypothetical protein